MQFIDLCFFLKELSSIFSYSVLYNTVVIIINGHVAGVVLNDSVKESALGDIIT